MVTDATFEQQYDALKRGRGFVELTNWSSVALTGNDRQKFLNNFCTNDIKKIAPGESCEAFITNVKGRIVGHGLISCREHELAFFGTPNQNPTLIEHLDRYVIREDVQLRDTTEEREYLLVTGETASQGPATDHQTFLPWNLIGGGRVGVLEFQAHESEPALNKLLASGHMAASSAAFTAARIEHGTPLFGIDFDDHNFPQEVGRDREAISFTKGCYLGQETVARIDALGHVNQALAGIQFLGNVVPAAGMELCKESSKVGIVSSAAFSPRLNAPLALAMVRREANSPGIVLQSPVGECVVVSLPLEHQGA